MGIEDLRAFVGQWELSVDLPGAEDVRGHVMFRQRYIGTFDDDSTTIKGSGRRRPTARSGIATSS